MKKLGIILTLWLTVTNVVSQEYSLVVDRYFSPYSGASITRSTYNFYKAIDDKYLPNGEGYNDFSWSFARLGKLSIDFVLGSFLSITQHEVFGHGYRAREFGFSHIGYDLYVTHGATYFLLEDYDNLNIYQQNAINAAGMEANKVLAKKVQRPWFKTRTFDYRDGLLYIFNKLDQVDYVMFTRSATASDGNDVNNYINGVNNYYGHTVLTNGKLRTAELWDLLDPSLYYSLYALSNFLVNGTPTMSFPMLKINDYHYLPTGNTILTPWGVEFQLQNFIVSPQNELYQLNVRYGSNSNITSYGIDFNQPIWKYDRWILNNQISMWVQPSMNYANALQTKRQFGFAEFVSFEYRAGENVSFIGDIGYKTAGYMPGFLLNNNYIFRIGIKW